MFSIFKRRKEFKVDYSSIRTDIHSHLLPGIDDGSPDSETSIRLIKGLQELGFSNFIATPHIYQELHPNDHTTIENSLEVLNTACAEHQFSTNIKAAAEYFLDEHFNQLIEEETPLRTIHENWVLIEWSFVQPPFDLRQTLFNLQIKGYQPVIAHPERYAYYYKSWGELDQLIHAGAYLQMNLLSLFGYYGKTEQKIAEYLIQNDKYRLVGTDLHHEKHLRALQAGGQQWNFLMKLAESKNFLNSTIV